MTEIAYVLHWLLVYGVGVLIGLPLAIWLLVAVWERLIRWRAQLGVLIKRGGTPSAPVR